MADWKQIPDTDVDPDAPVTSELMYALRDNPVAIADGATGAPRVMGIALDTFLAHGSAAINDSTTSLAFVGMDRVGEILVAFNAVGDNTSGSPVIQVSFTNNNGTSWGAWQSLTRYTVPASSDVSLRGASYLFTVSLKNAIACMLYGSNGASVVRSGQIVTNLTNTLSDTNGIRFKSNSIAFGQTSIALWAIGGVA